MQGSQLAAKRKGSRPRRRASEPAGMEHLEAQKARGACEYGSWTAHNLERFRLLCLQQLGVQAPARSWLYVLDIPLQVHAPGSNGVHVVKVGLHKDITKALNEDYRTWKNLGSEDDPFMGQGLPADVKELATAESVILTAPPGSIPMAGDLAQSIATLLGSPLDPLVMRRLVAHWNSRSRGYHDKIPTNISDHKYVLAPISRIRLLQELFVNAAAQPAFDAERILQTFCTELACVRTTLTSTRLQVTPPWAAGEDFGRGILHAIPSDEQVCRAVRKFDGVRRDNVTFRYVQVCLITEAGAQSESAARKVVRLMRNGRTVWQHSPENMPPPVFATMRNLTDWLKLQLQHPVHQQLHFADMRFGSLHPSDAVPSSIFDTEIFVQLLSRTPKQMYATLISRHDVDWHATHSFWVLHRPRTPVILAGAVHLNVVAIGDRVSLRSHEETITAELSESADGTTVCLTCADLGVEGPARFDCFAAFVDAANSRRAAFAEQLQQLTHDDLRFTACTGGTRTFGQVQSEYLEQLLDSDVDNALHGIGLQVDSAIVRTKWRVHETPEYWIVRWLSSQDELADVSSASLNALGFASSAAEEFAHVLQSRRRSELPSWQLARVVQGMFEAAGTSDSKPHGLSSTPQQLSYKGTQTWAVTSNTADEAEDDCYIRALQRLLQATGIPGMLDGEQHRMFFHGTTPTAALSIVTRGIQLEFGRRYCDFGASNAFYVSENVVDAADWPVVCPTVIVFRIPNDEFERLRVLDFGAGTTQPAWTWSEVIRAYRYESQLADMDSSRTLDRLEHAIATQPIDIVRGDTCTNAKQVARGAAPIPIRPPLTQLALRSARAAQLFHQHIVGVLYFSS